MANNNSMPRAKSLVEVAEFFGIGMTTLQQGWRVRGCPLEKQKDGYDLSAIAVWKIQHEQSRRSSVQADVLAASAEGADADREKLIGLRQANELRAFEIAEKNGRLVDMVQLSGMLSVIAIALREATQRIEARHGVEAGDQIRDVIDDMTKLMQADEVATLAESVRDKSEVCFGGKGGSSSHWCH